MCQIQGLEYVGNKTILGALLPVYSMRASFIDTPHGSFLFSEFGPHSAQFRAAKAAWLRERSQYKSREARA